MNPLEWKKLPTGWINKESFYEFRWIRNEGSTSAAALMIYIALGVYASPIDDPGMGLETGESSPTYDEIRRFCGISRELVNRGIKKLESLGLITKKRKGVKTVYHITGLETWSNKKWGKVPYKYFSRKGVMRSVFSEFSIRNKSTLHALKIYLMAIKFRDNKNNYALFSYDKIVEMAGIPKFEIKQALQLLSNNKLLIIDLIEAKYNDYRQNAYRIIGINNTMHLATLPGYQLDDLKKQF